MRQIVTITLTLLLMAPLLIAGDPSEEEAVRAAIADYVEGLYQVDPERIERSVSPDLWKRGFYKSDGQYKLAPMTFQQLVQLAGRWNKDGDNAGANSPKEIVIYEVLDQTATAKLTAEWGIDYFHLAKVDGRWMILNVLWQSHPGK